MLMLRPELAKFRTVVIISIGLELSGIHEIWLNRPAASSPIQSFSTWRCCAKREIADAVFGGFIFGLPENDPVRETQPRHGKQQLRQNNLE
jgi:hypothetical protein